MLSLRCLSQARVVCSHHPACWGRRQNYAAESYRSVGPGSSGRCGISHTITSTYGKARQAQVYFLCVLFVAVCCCAFVHFQFQLSFFCCCAQEKRQHPETWARVSAEGLSSVVGSLIYRHCTHLSTFLWLVEFQRRFWRARNGRNVCLAAMWPSCFFLPCFASRDRFGTEAAVRRRPYDLSVLNEINRKRNHLWKDGLRRGVCVYFFIIYFANRHY